jgi:two-component system, LuxR family, response regulator TtrR
MTTETRPQTVVVVDDDDAMRDSLVWLLKSHGMSVVPFASAEAFLVGYPEAVGCVVLDVRMPGKSGMELYQEIAQRPDAPPVVFVTGHGDIQMAVSMLKKGAADFIEKPYNEKAIVTLIEQCLRQERERDVRRRQLAEIAQRLASLTAREREVMDRIIAGRLNKQIADELGISIKTVEVHRGRVMEKMVVSSVAELVQCIMGLRGS